MAQTEQAQDDEQAGSDIDFAREAAAERSGFFKELWLFLRENKKWWLTPIIVILILVGILVVLGSTAAAPYIYTLF